MFSNSAMFLLGLSLVVLANGNVVSFIDPCAVTDNACVLASSKKALPFIANGDTALGIPAGDPVIIEDITETIDNLNLGFKGLTVTGISKCELINIERTTRLDAKFEVECPITADGQYTMKGVLLGFEVFGSGAFKFVADKVKLSIDANLITITGKDGEEHYKVDKYDYKFDVLGPVDFDFENLFDGDKQKADPFITIIKNSGKELLLSAGPPFIKEIVKREVEVVNTFFEVAPNKEIELA